MSQDTNWIMQTGQTWKLYVAVAGFGGGLLCFTIGFFSLGSDYGRFLGLMACGIFLTLVTFLWFTFMLRCPHCMSKLVWTMVRSRPHSSWVIDLAGLEDCPVCRCSLSRERGVRI